MLLAATLYLKQSDALPPTLRVAGAVALAWSLTSLGGLLGRRPWAVPLEAARLCLGALLPLAVHAGPALAGAAVASGAWLAWALGKRLPLPTEVR